MEVFRSLSSPEEGHPRRRIVEEDGVPDCKIYIPNVTLVVGKERYMFKNSLVQLTIWPEAYPHYGTV